MEKYKVTYISTDLDNNLIGSTIIKHKDGHSDIIDMNDFNKYYEYEFIINELKKGKILKEINDDEASIGKFQNINNEQQFINEITSSSLLELNESLKQKRSL